MGTINSDKEIIKASESIDRALLRLTKETRGEFSVNILSSVRTLNDHIAYKLYKDLYPEKEPRINKVAGQFMNISVREYKFISSFNKFLQKALSHFVPTEDGGERLMIKYYKYLLRIKKLIKDLYNRDILINIDNFLEDLDEQTNEYYTNIANEVKSIFKKKNNKSRFDNYYITRTKEFFINREEYFEVTLEPAEEKSNKFNRITAFTKFEILSNYAVALSFEEGITDAFGVKFPIKVITGWQVSIRPCEIQNFARILKIPLKVNRGEKEYKKVMQILKDNFITFIDIVDLDDYIYNKIKKTVIEEAKNKNSKIFAILDMCRSIVNNNYSYKNIIRYLLLKMNNRIIKLQWPYNKDNSVNDYYLSKSCYPFEKNPFSFNPKGHVPNLYDLLMCFDIKLRRDDLLARIVNNKAELEGVLFNSHSDLSFFGSENEIDALIRKYNAKLWCGHKPASEIRDYRKHLYNYGNEKDIVYIISRLTDLSEIKTDCDLFKDSKVKELHALSKLAVKLDDDKKYNILVDMFSEAQVQFIYGAAGTGKSTMINYISYLMRDKKKLFLAKTHPAVENLRRIVLYDEKNTYSTIDKFLNDEIGLYFNDSRRYNLLHNNLKGKIVKIENNIGYVNFRLQVELILDKGDIDIFSDLKFIKHVGNETVVEFPVYRRLPYASDEESENNDHILPFQVAYAVSIHKSQGLEYNSVKIVIANETEEKITHNIFYTAITRAKKELTLYWSPEVCNKILSRIRPIKNSKDFQLLLQKNGLKNDVKFSKKT
jgi:GTPase SAR1 family protein/energy-coupling factor transporter ATP-binding protein EcfA2